MSLSLEQVDRHDGTVSASATQRNFAKLAEVVRDTGGVSLGWRFGRVTLTFTASTNSATVSVAHGLGKVPINVQATAHASPAFGNIPTPNITIVNASTFTINGEVKTAFTGTVTVMWQAVG